MIWIFVPILVAAVGLVLLRRYGRPSRNPAWDGGDPVYDAWSTSADTSTSDASFVAGGGDFGGAGTTGDWGGDTGGGDSGGGDGGGGGGD
jgi:hypothetical protein